MAAPVTLQTLIQEVRRRADIESATQYITDAEITQYLNRSAARWYDLLVEKFGDNYFRKVPSPSFTLVANQQDYPLATALGATDFYKLTGVDLVIDSLRRITLRRLMDDERNIYQNLFVTSWNYNGVANVRYEIVDQYLRFYPMPVLGGYSIIVHYIPIAPTLVNLTDTWDSINQWSELFVIDAARKCATKEQQDYTVNALTQEFNDYMQHLIQIAENRDAGEGTRVIDVTGNSGGPPWATNFYQ